MSKKAEQMSMLEDVENVSDVPLENGGPGYNKWELDFLVSVGEQLRSGRMLTEKQREKLRDLWDKI